MCVQDGFEGETMLTYYRNPVYITVQSCACYEMIVSLRPGSYQVYMLLG